MRYLDTYHDGEVPVGTNWVNADAVRDLLDGAFSYAGSDKLDLAGPAFQCIPIATGCHSDRKSFE